MRLGQATKVLTAAGLGERREVERLLGEEPVLAQARGEYGMTPLHRAAWGGYRGIATQLLDAGAAVDARDEDGRTPLIHMTVWCTRTDVVDLLLSRGADLNARDASGNTALYLAASCIRKPGHCWGDHEKLTRALLERGATIDLFTAAILNRSEEAEALIRQDPERLHARDRITARDSLGWNVVDGAAPLHRAADCGSLETARLLLEHGADPNGVDARGRTPIYLAAHDAGTRKKQPSPEVVELLLNHGATADLFAYAVLGRVEEATRLLDADGTQVHARDGGNNTPLHLAAWNGKVETVQLLLSRGADANAANRRGETPLSYGREEVVRLLLEQGARCTLHEATAMNRTDLVDRILEADPAAVNRPNRRGRTPLRIAVEAELFGNSAMRATAEHLLARGAAMDLWTAATWGRTDEMTRLLDRDPSGIDAFDNTVTPLHCAAQQGRLEAVKLLVERGAALDPVANDLATPAIWALWNGHKETARCLVEAGADIAAMDNWSENPWIASALA